MNADSVEMPHVTSEELAGYLEHRLEHESELRVEAHMAECASCRADLVQIRDVLGALPAGRAAAPEHRTWPRPAWLAAAGLVAVALIPLAMRIEQERAVAPVLRAGPPTSARITAVAPDPLAPGRAVDPANAVFTWRAVEGAGTYRITITDSAGTPVFTATTTDTSIVPPSSQPLAHGGSYLWYVDALRNDGTTWSTGVQSFTTTR